MVRSAFGEKVIVEASRSVVMRKVNKKEAVEGQQINKRIIDWKGYLHAWNALGYFYPSQSLVEGFQIQKKAIKYKKNLLLGLNLEGYRTRLDLNQAAQRWVQIERIKKILFLPFKVVRYVHVKIKNHFKL